MQPILRTQRLLLRPRGLIDTDDCVLMDREPEVTRYVSGPWSDPVAHRAFVEQRTRGPYADGLGYWTLARSDRPSEFVGWVLLIPLDAVGPEIEIGWRLRPVFWGLGYATEAARAVLQYGFESVGWTRSWLRSTGRISRRSKSPSGSGCDAGRRGQATAASGCDTPLPVMRTRSPRGA